MLTTMPRPVHWRATVIALSVILASTAAAFAPTLHNQFILDDDYIVVHNEPIRKLSNVPSFFVSTPPGSINRNYYRPVMLTSFALDHALFGLQPAGWHAVNILLHALCAVWVFLLLRELGSQTVVSLLGALLFALHPVQGEVVYLVNNRGTSISTLCFLIALTWHLRRREKGHSWHGAVGIGVLYFCAMGAKEVGVTLPAAMLLADLWLTPKLTFVATPVSGVDCRAYIACGIAAVAYFGARQLLCEPSGVSYFGNTPGTTVLAIMLVVEAYACMLSVLPFNLAGSYDGSYLPVPTSWFEPVLLLSAALLIGLMVLALRLQRRSPLVAFGLGFYFLALVPTVQLVRLPILFGERFLYLPMVGVCVIAAALLSSIEGASLARISRAAAIGVCLLFAWQSRARAYEWASAESFWRATVRARPDSVQAHVGLAATLGSSGRCAEAIPHYVFVLNRLGAVPADRVVFGETASCYARTRDPASARVIVQRWLASHPADNGFQSMLSTLDGQLSQAH
jgi:hypothetical protein